MRAIEGLKPGAVARVTTAALLLAVTAAALPALAQDSGRTEQAQDISSRRVTLNLENADLKYALKLLFTSAGANYTLDSGVQGIVTVSLTDVPFRTALESLLRSAQFQTPLTYRIENGVYNVGLRKEEKPENPGPVDIIAEPAKRSKIARIQLNYADPADITAALGGTMLQSRFAQFGMGFGGGNFGGSGMMGGAGNMGGGNGFGNGFGSSGIGIINLNSNGLGSFGNGGGQNGGNGFGAVGNFGTGFGGGGRNPGR
jgi:hypothetical protein